MPSALDIIRQRESGGRNIRQQIVPQSVSSASGYYQMIKPTWERWAKSVGVDTNRYPEAITAPEQLQRMVADHGFETEGFRPWAATRDLVGQEGRFSGGGALSTNGTPPSPRATSREQLEELLKAKYPELRVTSRDRDAAYNASVGGAKNSQHTHGTAFDVGLKGLPPEKQEEIIRTAKSYGAQGIGYYPNSQSAHFDLRTTGPAYWGQNYSKSSLGETPGWFQKIAGEASETAFPDSVPGVLNADGTAPAAPAAPVVTPAEAAAEAFDTALKEATPAPAAAPVEQKAPAAPAPVTGNEQGQAADLMAGLLARRRPSPMARGLTMPPGLLG